MSEEPEYKALTALFIAPYLIPKGSIFATHAAPSFEWEPQNDEAHARMEQWYNEEIPEIDTRTRLPVKLPDGTISMYKPHAKYRTAVYVEAEAATVRLIAAPKPDAVDMLDLGRARFANPGNGELRPAPDPVHSTQDGTKIKSFAKPIKEA